MGEVYRARDTRLDRAVALKVLPLELSSVPSWRQRFEREARALSSVSHPHICALHDVGSHEGVDFIVMELLEGETLSDRLQRSRRLSIDEVLQIAIAIADALDTAHRNGIVHRDLKPGNVMLTKTGVKLLDFGLAKLGQSAVKDVRPAATTAAPLTLEGTILGTLPYMAPEQLDGRDADVRTDIFAFGLVLYEMATGRRAFEGASQVTLMAAIVEHHPPPVSSLTPQSPPWLDQVVNGCLEKDPDKRWQSVADVLKQLRLIAEAPPAGEFAQTRSRSTAWLLMAALAVLVVAAAVGIPAALRSRGDPSPKVQLDLETPFSATPYQMAFSPSGSHLVLTITENGITRLWLRAMSTGRGETLMTTASTPGVAGASWPAWSPDERFLAFFSEGKLRTIDLRTKESMVVAEVPRPSGLTWGDHSIMLYGNDDTVFKISAGGGTPVPLQELARSGDGASHPSFLPDGRNFIYLVSSTTEENRGLYIASIDRPVGRRLVHAIARGAIVRPGYLLFVDPGGPTPTGTLMMQPFDLATLQSTGDATPVAEWVGVNVNTRASAFTASQTGLLVHRGFVTGTAVSNLKWFDRSGRGTVAIGNPGEYASAMLSPDGSLAIVVRVVRTIGETDLWTLDLARGVSNRFTSGGGTETGPLWSPHGDLIAYTSSQTGVGATGIYVKRSDASAPERMLLSTPGASAESWSPDGKYLLYRKEDAETRTDLWVLPMSDSGSPRPFLRSKYAETGSRISPDGRWVAYQSDESGRDEIYVTSFPVAGSRSQLSVSGGRNPKWRGDGKELFFDMSSGPSTAIMSVDIDLSSQRPRAGTPRTLFATPSTGWDVTRDGKRFLMVSPIEVSQSLQPLPPLTFIANWHK
jgi:Tol biopolymer transport system component